jgi:hypothetical protein
MAFPGEIGWIGRNCPEHPDQKLISTAMRSNAGYFIGTYCELCRLEDPSPNSRESGYYPSRETLVVAAFNGTVGWRDSRYKGMKLLACDDKDKCWAFDKKQAFSGRYAVICPEHGQVLLSDEQYNRQMDRPDDLWTCPTCHRSAQFDDELYEAQTDDGGPFDTGRFD